MHDLNTWHCLISGPCTGSRNMAVDEDLLDRAQAGRAGSFSPVLRFYEWAPPAVSLGRFQDARTAVDEEACRKYGIDVVRRVTGGRAVLHHRELTYSIVSPVENPLFPQDVLGTYRVIALALVAGLGMFGVRAELVSRDHAAASLVRRSPKNPACFSSPSWYELVVNGRKLVGSAQRRLSGAFLQHGSILLDYDAAFAAEVIRGPAGIDQVATLRQCLGREVAGEELIPALKLGFRETLGIVFREDEG